MTTSLVALRGAENTGKTTTLTKVRDFLRSCCPEAKEKEGSYQEFLVPDPLPNDFAVVFEIAGVTVGLCSGGDYLEDIQENVKALLVKQRCQIVLCATRIYNGGGTVEAVRKLAKDHSASFTSVYQISISDLTYTKERDFTETKAGVSVLKDYAELFEKATADIDALREVANETMLRYVIRMLKIEIKKQNPKAFSSKTCADL